MISCYSVRIITARVFGAWVVDEVTSPCIDAGNTDEMGWQNELWPHGGRINMGVYGGTSQASNVTQSGRHTQTWTMMTVLI